MPREEKNYFWIDWIQLFLIGLTAPLFLFPSMKYIWIFLIIPGIWICRWIIKRHFFERTLLDWAIVILSVQVFATCIIVPDISFSLPKIAGVILGLAFFYSIVALLVSEKLIRWGILAFLVSGFMLSVVGILGISHDWSDMRFNKSIPEIVRNIIFKIAKIIPTIKWNLPGAEEGFNSNAIGGTIILIIPLCLILLIPYLRRKKGSYLISNRLLSIIFFFVILFVTSCVLFLSISIGSWVGLFISICSIWILLLSRKWKKWSLAVIFLSLALIIIFNPGTNKSLSSSLKNDIENREPLWVVGVNTARQHPFFGIGMNQIRQTPSVSYEKSHVHNHLLHTAAELGVPGLLSYLAILIGAGFMCFEIWRRSNIGWMKMTALGLGCGQLAHLIFGMGDSIPLGAKVGIFFWFSIALIAAMYNYMLKSSK
ncbi:MAG: O-antigen ligase family protein [Candidatus Aminicenantes bacterium]|nr:O-antigen ligase family protein [Candidatus Aminicenantes bacterium]